MKTCFQYCKRNVSLIFQKPVLLCLLLCCANICICQKQTIFSGTIHTLDPGSKMYLSQTSRGELVDSLIVKGDSFEFKLNADEGDVYFIRFSVNMKRHDYAIYLQNGSNVNMIINDIKGPVTYIGSSLAEEQNDFYKGLYFIGNQLSSLNEELTTANDSNLNEKVKHNKKSIVIEQKEYCENWVRSHKNSSFSVAIIFLYLNQTDVETLQELYDNLTDKAKVNNLVTSALPLYLATKKFKQQFKVGEHIKDFALKDTSGITRSFSDLEGNNYVLVDFWASWCGPCRRNNPEIINLINAYQKNKFKVISVSADTDSEKWKEAIINDKMQWVHLSDLKGTDTGFMKERNIFAFPTYLLISPEGVIISSPFSIDRVKEQLVKLFSSTENRK